MQITVSSSKNPRNGLHMDLVGHKAGFDGGAGNPLWQLQAPSCFNNSVPSGRRKKAERKSLKSPSLFLPEHISSRSCFCSNHVMEWAQAVNMKKREASLTDPTSTFQTHYSRRACSPWMSCRSLGPPAVERHPLLEKFSGSKPRRSCVSACHIYLQDRLAIFIIRGRGEEGQTGRNTACLPRRCHLSFHILIM